MGFKIENPFKKVAQAVDRAVDKAVDTVGDAAKNVVRQADKAIDGFAKDVKRDVTSIVAQAVKTAHSLPSIDFGKIDLPKLDLPKIDIPQIGKGLGIGSILKGNIPEIKVPPFLRELFGTTRPELGKFVKSTEDFRGTLDTLNKLPPSDPRYQAAAAHLQQRYGYTPQTAPKPGQLWISPRLTLKELPNGDPTASKFPPGKPVFDPPSPTDLLFANGRKPTIVLADGTQVTPQTPEEYKALVAKTRADLGIKNPDGSPAGGEPKSVHLTMEGGGGNGKRYAPAFQEMYAMGIVPTSVSGTSVGAIAAGYIAAGADPKTVGELASDPNVAKFFDFQLGGSGLVKGEYMYKYVDQKLREITGIKDRPVTFADLKIPAQIPAVVLSDSMPPKGKEDLTKPENRMFVFSQETTPNTPVVYAMLASGAFPGVLPTVDLVDPTTGRKLVLTDSGVLDGVPMDMGNDGLPEVGLTLQEPWSNHPGAPEHNATEKPLPKGDVDSSNPVAYGLNSLKMLKDSAAEAKDFRDRTQPKPGEFMLAIPVFNKDDARLRDKSLKFHYDDKVDPALDQQNRVVVRDFFQKVFNDIGDPTKSATNIVTQVPKDLSYTRMIDYDGKRYTATYAGGEAIRFTGSDGKVIDVNVGRLKAEAMYLDEVAFDSIEGELKVVLDHHLNPINKTLYDLPF